MRVAITFPGCHREGGMERVVYECARFLAGRGHRVTVFANAWEDDTSPRINYQKVPISVACPRFLRGLYFFQECSKRLDLTEFDVVNTHGCVSPLDGVHWAHSIHRAWLDRSKATRRPYSFSRLQQRMNPFHPIALRLEAKHFQERRYRKIIALTAESKADITRIYRIPDDDIEMIAPGFAPEEFNVVDRTTRRAEMRRKFGFSGTDKVVIFVANELKRKGFGALLDAVASLNESTVHILVVGRVRESEYRKRSDDLGLSSHLHYAGVVTVQELAACYLAADVFALPTQYEGWGLVIVEALACGLPVLTSRVAPASTAVQEGETGLLIDDPLCVGEIARKLRSLLQEDHVRHVQISNSVASYAWSTALLPYERVLLQQCA